MLRTFPISVNFPERRPPLSLTLYITSLCGHLASRSNFSFSFGSNFSKITEKRIVKKREVHNLVLESFPSRLFKVRLAFENLTWDVNYDKKV